MTKGLTGGTGGVPRTCTTHDQRIADALERIADALEKREGGCDHDWVDAPVDGFQCCTKCQLWTSPVADWETT